MAGGGDRVVGSARLVAAPSAYHSWALKRGGWRFVAGGLACLRDAKLPHRGPVVVAAVRAEMS
jgi:hypothetical protein